MWSLLVPVALAGASRPVVRGVLVDEVACASAFDRPEELLRHGLAHWAAVGLPTGAVLIGAVDEAMCCGGPKVVVMDEHGTPLGYLELHPDCTVDRQGTVRRDVHPTRRRPLVVPEGPTEAT